MQKILYTLILIFLIIKTADSQWIQQNSGSSTDFHSVKFINKNTGWACGTGTILKTTNGGINWVAQNHPAISKRLASISIVDSLNLYCVGWFETILKTTNGGTNWTAIRNGPGGTGSSYDACYFINKNIGWIGGSGQKIWKTTNGGDSLLYIYVDAGYIYDMHFKDSLTGLMCGDAGFLKRTTNGGINWYTPNIQLHFQGHTFDKLSILNNQYGWIVGEQVYPVYRTTDFGENWDSIGRVAGAFDLYSIRFSSINTGWCGGGGTPAGRMFKTTDGGFTWQQYNNTITCYFGDYYFYNDSIGWAVGSNGVILKTTNGGISFVNQISIRIPKDFSLNQNYPNPFNPSTNIKYQIKENKFVTLKVFDLLGKEVATLVNEKQSPGTYEVTFDARALSSGIYFYTLYADGLLIDCKKMILMK
jgi:photosystem II stability/assembly factor-like uncharacterized protein